MSGGCQGCGLAKVTLSQGIAVAIQDAVPEVPRDRRRHRPRHRREPVLRGREEVAAEPSQCAAAGTGGTSTVAHAALPHRRGVPRARASWSCWRACPPGLGCTSEDVAGELARRRLGYGRGPRMRFEQDEVTLLAGIRHGRSLGSPIAIEIANTEWPKWEEEMSPLPGHPPRQLTAPRPGHADLAGMLKYGFSDARDVLERASARETAARVAAGCVAKALLRAARRRRPQPRRRPRRRHRARGRSRP